MKVTIDLVARSDHGPYPRKGDIQRNIDALKRYVDGKARSNDAVLLIDTLSILYVIKRKLPND